MATVPTLDETVSALSTLGFQAVEGETNTLAIEVGPSSYRLTVTKGKTSGTSKIDFGSKITAGRKISLAQRESIVVIECVIQLLKSGYLPESISLEKAYPLGHGKGGWLDVLVSKEGSPYWMIECKTWGAEYKKHLNKLKSNGGQLFTYWVQDRDAQWLTLYSSRIRENEVDRANVTLSTQGLSGSSVESVYVSWDGELSELDLITSPPYELHDRQLRVGDLRDIREDDSSEIFHEFEEILRRNAVSDKPNAFNKIFNLFICKVQDEEKTDREQTVDFYWGVDEDSESVLNRLSQLYVDGLQNFLQVDVPNHSLEQLHSILSTLPGENRDEVLRAFSELKTLSNSDFSFIDVYDHTTFRKNAQVVKEVVQLLQNIRIRYSHKQPFMGDFFERLLNTSVKQEQGQYFTPIPLARFVLDSLPLQAITEAKKSRGDSNFLPYIIDYAAGAGHFLTEGMDVISEIMESLQSGSLTRSQRDNLSSWSNLKWAREFVYGIEKDYRLAKTAKVACFLNGDGEANIITADGLANFSDPESGYINRLKMQTKGKDNPKFDVVVANPPYSVEDCKSKVSNGQSSFDLWPRLTQSSDDIECLFAERTKQLLGADGVAGIIFPSSIAQSSGAVFVESRKLLLQNFDIIGLVSLGTNAFSDANVRTTIFFMKRVDDGRWKAIQVGVRRYFQSWSDAAIDSISDPVAKYCESVHGYKVEDYVKAIRDRNISVCANLIAPYVRYLGNLRKPLDPDDEKFWEYVLQTEQDKISYFIRTMDRNVVVSNSPSPVQEQKKFLGYGFKTVNGSRAMVPTKNSSFDSVISRSGEGSLSNAIRENFDNELREFPETLKNNSSLVAMHDLIDFEQAKFDLSLSTVPPFVDNEVRHKTEILGDLVADHAGIWEGSSDSRVETPVLRNTEFKYRDVLAVDEAAIVNADSSGVDRYYLRHGDILLERSGGSENQHVGRTRIFDGNRAEVAFSNFIVRLRVNDPSVVMPDFLFHFLQRRYDIGAFANMQKATNGFQNLDLEKFLRMKVPMVPLDVQEKFVSEVGSVRAEIDRLEDAIARDLSSVESLLSSLPLSSIRDVAKQVDVAVRVGSLPERVNLVELANIETGTGRRVGDYWTNRERIESNKRAFEPRDVLYGRLRPNLNKVLVADDAGHASTEVVVLRPDVDPVLLAYSMRRDSFVESAVFSVKGMKMPRVPLGKLNDFRVPVTEDSSTISKVRELDCRITSAREEVSMLWKEIDTLRDQVTA